MILQALNKHCLPTGTPKPICASTLLAIGLSGGCYFALRRSDLKFLNGYIDLNKSDDNNYSTVAKISTAVGILTFGGSLLTASLLLKK